MTKNKIRVDVFMPTPDRDEVIVESYWLDVEPEAMVEYLELNNIAQYDYDLDDGDYYKKIVYWSVSFSNWFWITTPVSKYQTVVKLIEHLPRRYSK